MKRAFMLAASLFAFLYSSYSLAGPTKILDSTFVRETGAPFAAYELFNGAEGTATIKVLNGIDAPRVSSAAVIVNGTPVFGSSDFSQNTDFLEKEIALNEGTNILEVLLMGKPGGAATIQVFQLTEFSGRYCLTLTSTSSTLSPNNRTELSLDTMISQSGDAVTFIATGPGRVTGTGTVSGDTMQLAGSVAGDLWTITADIAFSGDGRSLSGSYTSFFEGIFDEVGVVSGKAGACAEYTFPAGAPLCILPVADIAKVVGGQTFNSESGGVLHTGIDFEFAESLQEIVAPCAGVITLKTRRDINEEGKIGFDVGITFNENWNTFITFEPDSVDPDIDLLQDGEIDAPLNQVVSPGDPIGRLVVPPGAEFPHIHWDMVTSDTFIFLCAYDFLEEPEKDKLDARFNVIDPVKLQPVCIESP